MRARLALLVSGITCEIRGVKLSAKPAAMLAASPKGTVPVLVLPDGEVIAESIDVMRWALGQNDLELWLMRDDDALIAVNDRAFKHHLDHYKYPERHGSDASDHRASGLALLQVLEDRLTTATNLCGDERGITDMALLPFVRQFAAVDRPWFDMQPLPHLQNWLARHLASPLFDAAMVRLPPWQPDDPPTVFPASSQALS